MSLRVFSRCSVLLGGNRHVSCGTVVGFVDGAYQLRFLDYFLTFLKGADFEGSCHQWFREGLELSFILDLQTERGLAYFCQIGFCWLITSELSAYM